MYNFLQPPPQDVLQSVQSVHSESLQSAFRATVHGFVSLKLPEQGVPPSCSMCSTPRTRNAWAIDRPSHSFHSDQSPQRQSCFSRTLGHSDGRHSGPLAVSTVAPSQGRPYIIVHDSMIV